MCKYSQKLRFNENGKFKIAQFADMHYDTDQNDNDRNSKLQNIIIEVEKPDFIAFTGDQVSGYEWTGEKGWYEKYYNMCITPVNTMKIPYSIIMGNHDYEADSNPEDIIEFELRKEYSMTERGPKNISGTTNYYIPIYNNNEDKIEYIMWFFDSQNKECLGKNHWGCVGNDTIEWYIKESNILKSKYGRIIPGIAFMHIPPPEYMEMSNINLINGTKEESVSCPIVNNNIISTFDKIGNINGVFVGHNHRNDYSVKYSDKITLYYGRKSGYGCYSSNVLLKGSRIIIINSKTKYINSYIRNVNGEIETSRTNKAEYQESCDTNDYNKNENKYFKI